MVGKKNFIEIAGKIADNILVPGYVTAVVNAFSDAQDEIKAAELKGMVELEMEAQKQKIIMEFQAHQARVSQEVAIAERIATSHEVEITEYYDAHGKGSAGLGIQDSNISIGVGGEGRRVTHRVIRFSGSNKFSDTDSEQIAS
ncbi:hypothetical protein GCM10011497_25770 [Elstera cyanobacteriorum]|uniref:Uncharacterized protein n=1 Tax=Elstera cyanobacteriorum TaxID=2022747 RepID=A0A255XM78_9PROT|nr:hypothetical protein [Elstera cyanobacteriorum]OYQ17504.1 hypothetical protein CHR90_16295 [Elstera cyanobacteriorum]GFZ94439.1 hypothetical protein GCM10011497_25770 [Elstera cyanobacteriorum]